MALDDIRESTPEELENGPQPRGDLGAWLYVLGGIPIMILFFMVLFGIVNSCDTQNVMIHG
jgi:hypothetical protein